MKLKLLKDRFNVKAGTIVYPYTGYTYGLVSEDEYLTGEEHIAATVNEDGSTPFFTVPIDDLEKI